MLEQSIADVGIGTKESLTEIPDEAKTDGNISMKKLM